MNKKASRSNKKEFGDKASLIKTINWSLSLLNVAVPNLVSEKTIRFQRKNKDPVLLSQQIIQQLTAKDYQTQCTIKHVGIIIQAQKAGVLRGIITADRAFSILLTGQPNDFSIQVDIGKWIQNLAVTTVEAVLTLLLFLSVDVPEMLWTREVEKGIIQEIKGIVLTGDN